MSNRLLTKTYDMGLLDAQGRRLRYRVQMVKEDACVTVRGHQMRDSRLFGRGSTPLRVNSWEEATALAESLAEKHRRYLERTHAKTFLAAMSLEEDVEEIITCLS